jgi:hypothetical protein
MKTKFILFLLVVAVPVFGQTNTVGIPALPPEGTVYNDDMIFWAGVTLGFVFGGSAWIFRLVRQIGHQNPEI